MYKHLPKMCGAHCRRRGFLSDFRLHPERIEAAITSCTKLLVLASPNNPTGITYTQTELAAAAIASCHGLLVISDEIYDAFVMSPTAALLPCCRGRHPAQGYSKTYGMTGWRLGYAAGFQGDH